MKNKQLEKDLHNYFKVYKALSNKYNLSPNKNEYGIINSENELEEINKYINLILDEEKEKEKDNYNFSPPQIDFEITKFSKDSILLNKEIKEYKNIYKEYYNKITKNKIIHEKDEESGHQNEINEKNKIIKNNIK